jgi:hypothetical protein
MLSLITRAQAFIKYLPGYTPYQDGNSTHIVHITRTDGDKSAPNFLLLEAERGNVMILHSRHYITRNGERIFRPLEPGEKLNMIHCRPKRKTIQLVAAVIDAVKEQHARDLAWLAEQPAE